MLSFFSPSDFEGGQGWIWSHTPKIDVKVPKPSLLLSLMDSNMEEFSKHSLLHKNQEKIFVTNKFKVQVKESSANCERKNYLEKYALQLKPVRNIREWNLYS